MKPTQEQDEPEEEDPLSFPNASQSYYWQFNERAKSLVDRQKEGKKNDWAGMSCYHPNDEAYKKEISRRDKRYRDEHSMLSVGLKSHNFATFF